MARESIPTWFFALVVVRLGHRVLVVQEREYGQSWYLPAGRVEPGESLVDAAARETVEETGVPVVMEGILQIQHTPVDDGARVRVVYVARALDDTPPLDAESEHSMQAKWVTLDELKSMPIRGHEVVYFFEQVLNGAPIYPLSLIGSEYPDSR